MKLTHKKWKEVLTLVPNKRIILVETLGEPKGPPSKEIEYSRNIYMIDESDNIIWQVQSGFDADGFSGPFTGLRMRPAGFDDLSRITYETEALQAYRWNGGLYGIDLETGWATPLILVRF
jgi:hypothetical protein